MSDLLGLLLPRYFAEAGVPVADESTAPGREPPGPTELTDIAARHGIRFWSGT